MHAPAARTALRTAAAAARSAQPALVRPAALPALRSFASSSPLPSSAAPDSSPATSPAAPTASTSASTSSAATRPEGTPQPTKLPGSNLGPPSGATKYSPLTVSLVTKLAKLFGYHSQTSTAIRTTSDYYDRCAERGEVEAAFFYEECSLPPSFQTWFSLTTLHVWLLSVRFRSLPPPLGRTYVQELINHMFIDVELRIRGPYAVTQSRLIKGYMNDMLEQYHGACAAYDEGLVRGDAVLAAAIWRNVFGAGWGGVGGVEGKRAPKAGEKPKLGPNPLQVEADGAVDVPGVAKPASTSSSSQAPLEVDPVQAKLLKKDQPASSLFATDAPIQDPAVATSTWSPLYPTDPDLEFPQSLERFVVYVRREVQRLERLSDDVVMQGKPDKGRGSLVDFGKF